MALWRLTTLILVPTLVFAQQSRQVYLCQSKSGGSTTYQDFPCAPGNGGPAGATPSAARSTAVSAQQGTAAARIGDIRNVDHMAGTMEVFTRANSDTARWMTIATPAAEAARALREEQYQTRLKRDAEAAANGPSGWRTAEAARQAREDAANAPRPGDLGYGRYMDPTNSRNRVRRSSYQTRDNFGNLVSSQDNYLTKDVAGSVVNSRDSYLTKDSFGATVNSRSCYTTNDSLGNLVQTSGCRK